MPSEPDNSELEARLRELAPMVEAMHATEGQLPPEKRELLLKQIAEGAYERERKKYYEGLWESLALAIAQVPLEFRKEWAKLPELLDDIRPVLPNSIYAEQVLMKTSLSSPQMPEGLMKDLRQRLSRSVQLEDADLIRLPELLWNTPDAQQRWEALCTEPATAPAPDTIDGGRPSTKEGEYRCPYCWRSFGAKDFMMVATHPELNRDPHLGEGYYLRFQPTRMAGGKYLDPNGSVATELACPHCHVILPRNIKSHSGDGWISLN